MDSKVKKNGKENIGNSVKGRGTTVNLFNGEIMPSESNAKIESDIYGGGFKGQEMMIIPSGRAVGYSSYQLQQDIDESKG